MNDCCLYGWTYVLPYGWVMCADHEDTAIPQPDSTWVVHWRNHQP